MEKYLVLHSFNSFGKRHLRGDVVLATDIRSPGLRQSEGKIILAVPSTEVPAEEVLVSAKAPSRVLSEDEIQPKKKPDKPSKKKLSLTKPPKKD